MTYARTALQDLSTANPIYANAIVTAYVADQFGEKTTLKADLYANISGDGRLRNPQTLDSKGKFRQPVYINQVVILEITGLHNVPDHDTGVIAPPLSILSGIGDPEGVVYAPIGSLYLRSDGGANSTLYVKEGDSGSNTGWAAK